MSHNVSNAGFNWTFVLMWTAALFISVSFWRGLGLGVMALIRLGVFLCR